MKFCILCGVNRRINDFENDWEGHERSAPENSPDPEDSSVLRDDENSFLEARNPSIQDFKTRQIKTEKSFSDRCSSPNHVHQKEESTPTLMVFQFLFFPKAHSRDKACRIHTEGILQAVSESEESQCPLFVCKYTYSQFHHIRYFRRRDTAWRRIFLKGV
ncbi:hypothetical protein CEXT_642981 [Caerostris extrusa]|uniref:Uncharacterized protein n=1 Tax=Caerostris extrusa TaxID=172846 RepID=A0AAV4WZ00_CAEEX|nr:hypothetical protein CEXT_642981 [Caerostris extrusa]